MISRYVNMIFVPIIKLCGLIKPIEIVSSDNYNSLLTTTIITEKRAS